MINICLFFHPHSLISFCWFIKKYIILRDVIVTSAAGRQNGNDKFYFLASFKLVRKFVLRLHYSWMHFSPWLQRHRTQHTKWSELNEKNRDGTLKINLYSSNVCILSERKLAKEQDRNSKTSRRSQLAEKNLPIICRANSPLRRNIRLLFH